MILREASQNGSVADIRGWSRAIAACGGHGLLAGRVRGKGCWEKLRFGQMARIASLVASLGASAVGAYDLGGLAM